MTVWRVHVEVQDHPGRLGTLTTAIGAAGGDILRLHLVGEPADDGTVTDELLIRLPTEVAPETLRAAVSGTGFACTLMLPADVTELADPATTSLALARMVAADPGSAAKAAAILLHALPADPTGGGHEFVATLRVGVQVLHLRRQWPFTATEISRAAALLELAAQLEVRTPRPVTGQLLQLRDGSEVQLRAAGPPDAPLVAALHARCSPRSRRARFLSPAAQLPPAELAELLGGTSSGGGTLLALTVDGGSAVGVATVTAPADGATRRAVLTVLVEDAWQRRGLGTALLRRVTERAVELGAHELAGTVRPDEAGLSRLLRRAGLCPSTEPVADGLLLRAPLPAPAG